MTDDERPQALNLEAKAAARISGGCLCGAVRFRLTTLNNAVMCHCGMCRKAQGALFACNFPVNSSQFEYVCGEEHVQLFKSSTFKMRAFCGTCGSPLFSKKGGTDILRIRSGSLDSTAELRVVAHIFAGNIPGWSPIEDALPRHKGFEPERKT